jgi:hypothetical protein
VGAGTLLEFPGYSSDRWDCTCGLHLLAVDCTVTWKECDLSEGWAGLAEAWCQAGEGSARVDECC